MNNHDRFYSETNLERDLRREKSATWRFWFLAVVFFSTLGGATMWFFTPGF